MEFVGNQINLKTVSATLAAAFLIGRINLFEGTFPAAIALITVMAAVSTVYIYLVPVMAAAMMTFSGQGLDFYGDMAAMTLCGVFFLFFHKQRFTINQRTAAAVAMMILCSCIYYAGEHMLYLLSVRTLLKEAAAVVIYIRVFNTLAKAIFVGKDSSAVTGEKAGISYIIAAVSVMGAAGNSQVTLFLWILGILTAACCKGIQSAMAMTAAAAVFSQCQGGTHPEIFVYMMTALLAGWFFAALIDGNYRKTVLSMTMFAVLAVSAGEQIYSAAAASAVFIALPQRILVKLWCMLQERLVPETANDLDLKLYAVKGNLMRKKQAFSALAKLYGESMDNRQIISYQFAGMARTVDCLLADLAENAALGGRELPGLPVGTASYAFEEVSGDSCMSFSFGKNKQALIISDGMGKGSRAAAESQLVVNTMSELLLAGFDVDLAIKTVNSILMTGNQSDMFATVDLAIINKENGRAQIFKMGAASTFVKNDGKVSMLKRPAPPAGVAKGMKLEYLDVRLKKGDLLIMVSDGITDCDRNDPDCLWLRERLLQMGSRNPDTVAELIVNKAAEKYGLHERDDLTVMVAAI